MQTYSDLILQDDLRAKLHEEHSDFKANLNEDNTLLLDTIDTSLVFKRETSNIIDIIDEENDSHEDDLNQLLFKTVQAQLQVKSTKNNDTSFESTNNAVSTSDSSPLKLRYSLLPRRIQLIATNTEFGDFCFFTETAV
jgi:hypothetical protein